MSALDIFKSVADICRIQELVFIFMVTDRILHPHDALKFDAVPGNFGNRGGSSSTVGRCSPVVPQCSTFAAHVPPWLALRVMDGACARTGPW
eukprot:3588206-Rhodomonas_salina.1